MKPIFIRTFERTIRPIIVIAACLLGIAASGIIGGIVSSEEASTFINRMNEACLYQHLIVFFAFGGLFLMNVCISNASGIIANEVHEGTFRLLIAKPNSREEILLAKIIGVFSASYLLYVLALVVYFAALSLTAGADGNIINGMAAYIPSYLLYGLLIDFIFVGLSSLLSCVFKKKITALLPMLLIVVAILGFFPIYRVVSSLATMSNGSEAAWYDLNYHFASLFNLCVETCGKIQGSSSQVSVTNILMSLFKSVSMDADIVRTQNAGQMMSINDTLNIWGLLTGYLFVAGGAYAGSFAIIRKKDI